MFRTCTKESTLMARWGCGLSVITVITAYWPPLVQQCGGARLQLHELCPPFRAYIITSGWCDVLYCMCIQVRPIGDYILARVPLSLACKGRVMVKAVFKQLSHPDNVGKTSSCAST